MVSKLLTKCEQILIPLRRAIPVDQAVIITMMAHLEESIVAISRIQDLLKATPATVPLHLILSRKTRIDDYIIGAVGYTWKICLMCLLAQVHTTTQTIARTRTTLGSTYWLMHTIFS